jgi:galactokinase
MAPTRQQQRKSKKSVIKKKKNKQKKKNIGFTTAISKIKKDIVKKRPNTLGDAVRVALKSANNLKNKIKTFRVIKIPKTGGILPLIPIFAGLSALGALTGGAAGVAKAVNDARQAKQELNETQRHNKQMEAIAMGKGIYLKPYKTGLGLFLHPPPASMQRYKS